MVTIKQKLVAEKIVENHGNISKTMEEVGYAKKTAKNPKNLTESKGWQELMDKYIPDSLLAKKHKELLTIPKKVRNFVKGEIESEYEELDSNAISKGLDMGYKLKGRYAADKIEHSGGIKYDIDPEFEKIILKTLEERDKKEK